MNTLYSMSPTLANLLAFVQNTLSFMDECDKMKVLMHLHSFTYDYHLRCIHSYISGRQMIFKQGYHLTNFLDDFIKYYPKGPNFARNTVHLGKCLMCCTSFIECFLTLVPVY